MKTKTLRKNSGSGSRSSVADPTSAYAQDVLAGRIIAGPHVRAACARHLRDLKTGSARGLVWRPDLANRVIRYFRVVLRLAGGEHEGNPFELEGWQMFVAGSLFGWLGPDGYRRFRTAFIETGKGSGKSPFAAGIGMYMLHADSEPRAQVYAAATKKDQAMVLFRSAVAMAEQSPHLSAHLVKSGRDPVWQLSHLHSRSFFRPISSDDGQSGPEVHCGLIDEVHEHKSAQVIDMIRAGTKGRRQALILAITNSGHNRQSVCFTMHEYGTKVAAGQLEDDGYFAYICAVDEGEDPLTDKPDKALGYPRSWAKANPSLGVTIQLKYLEEQVREARGMPSKESVVRRLNFCQWVDASNPWIDGDLWRECEVEDLVVPAGGVLSLDLGSKRDMVSAGRTVLGEDGVLRAEVRYWTPADTLDERERMDRVPYSAWVRDGFLRAVPGRSIDYAFVVRDVMDWLKDATALAFDQWKMDDFLRELDAAGVDAWIWDPPKRVDGAGIRLVRHGQGWAGGGVDLDPKTGEPMSRRTLWMPQSIGALEDAVVNGKLLVRKNPCLTWNSASAVLARDAAENPKWEKRKSTGRIDGIVTLSMGVGLATQPAPVKPTHSMFFLGGRR